MVETLKAELEIERWRVRFWRASHHAASPLLEKGSPDHSEVVRQIEQAKAELDRLGALP